MEEQNCDASNGCLGDPNSLYEGNIQVPLDVLIQLFPVDNRANLEIFTLDLAALLFIPICFEVNVIVNMVIVSSDSISIRNNFFFLIVCVALLYFACALCSKAWPSELLILLRALR